jgi:hypothetical protein
VDEEGRETATPKMYLDAFKDAMMGNIQNNVPVNSKKSQEGLIEEILDVLSDNYDVDENQARKQILRTYGRMGIGGYKLLIDPAKKEISPQDKPPSVPEPQEQAQTAPAPGGQEAAGPEPGDTPTERVYRPATEGQFRGRVASDIDIKELTSDDLMSLSDYKSGMRKLRDGRSMTVGNLDGYEWGVSRGLPSTPDGEDKLIASRSKVTPEAAPAAPAPAPAAASKKPGRGLNVPAQPASRGGGGFTPEAGKAAMDTIRQAANSGKTPQEVVEQFKQGSLFGGAGFETESASTNPLEDSPADPYERFRGDPAEKFKGAQEGGRETSSGSLFVSPQTAAKRGVKGTIDTESGPVKNPELYTSPRTGSGYGSAGQEQKGAIESKKSIQASAYEGMTPEQKNEEVAKLVKDGTSLSKARKQVGVKSRSAKKAPKPKKSFSGAEYQEFAQSVRSMMR